MERHPGTQKEAGLFEREAAEEKERSNTAEHRYGTMLTNCYLVIDSNELSYKEITP